MYCSTQYANPHHRITIVVAAAVNNSLTIDAIAVPSVAYAAPHYFYHSRRWRAAAVAAVWLVAFY